MKSTFAERLKEALKYNGMSAAELCRLTGTPESVMSQYKSGKYVAKQKTIRCLCKYSKRFYTLANGGRCSYERCFAITGRSNPL